MTMTDEQKREPKRCPLRMAGQPGGPWGTWECAERECAWWVELESCQACAVTLQTFAGVAINAIARQNAH